jgi:hypothetical protein
VALVTQLVVLASRAGRELRQGVARALTEIGRLYESVAGAYLKGDYPQQLIEKQKDVVRQVLRGTDDLLRDVVHEPFGRHPHEPLWVALAGEAHDLRDHVLALDQAARSAQDDSFYRKLDPRLSELVAVSSATFHWLADALSQTPSASAPDLKRAVTAVDDEFTRLRQVHASSAHPIEEVLRFCTFYFTLRNIARDLSLRAVQVQGEKTGEST